MKRKTIKFLAICGTGLGAPDRENDLEGCWLILMYTAL